MKQLAASANRAALPSISSDSHERRRAMLGASSSFVIVSILVVVDSGNIGDDKSGFPDGDTAVQLAACNANDMHKSFSAVIEPRCFSISS